MQFELERIAGDDLALELHAVDLHEIGRVVLRIGDVAQHHDSAALRHRLDDEHAGHHRFVGEMPHEEGFVHRHILDAGDRVVVHVENPVHQQERRTVGKHTPDVVDVVDGRLAAVVLVARTLALLTDRAAQLLHELRIGEMPGTRCPDTALDAHAEQCEVAQQIEQLVTRQLVGKTQFEIIEIAARDADVLLVEDLFEVGQLFVRNGIFHYDDRIVQIAALDEVHLEERFQFVQEDERPARSDLRGVVVVGKEGGVLVADDLRVVVDVHRGGELLVGIEDDRNALVGNRVDHLFGHLVVFAVGVLLDEARGDDLFGVFARRTVHDRGFGCVDVDQRVVDAERPERRHDVFYRGYLHAVGLDGRPARSVGHIIAQRRDERGSLHVDATENDAVVHTGGIDRHGHLDTRVQSLTRKGDRAFQGLLFC